MKIVIAATENTLESKVDKHFARCSYFFIYDTANQTHEFIENNYKYLIEDAGVQVVKFLFKKKINKVIACDFGIKATKILNEKKIQQVVFPNRDKTIQEIINYLNTKKNENCNPNKKQ